MDASYLFPQGFVWGTATAAYQIEGAVAEGGRKPSVWDTFSKKRVRLRKPDTGAVACDHYHRYRDDVKLMADLGLRHYRFSIAWPRVVPDGRGPVNEQGVDFYKRLLDELGKHGITPWVTLFHWDSPQALEDEYGSWQSRRIADDFAEYCGAVVSRLGDRVTRWITINEIPCFTTWGYGVGKRPVHAPGTIVGRERDVRQTVHHALLAHGKGVQAVRAASPRPCQVGLVDNPIVAVPLVETPEHVEAASKALRRERGDILGPVFDGAYDPGWLADVGSEAPQVADGDLATIHQAMDFLGLNLYTGVYVRAADNARGYELLPLPASYPRLHMPWLHIVPDVIYWGARHVAQAFGQRDLPVYITENGCAVEDQLTSGGEVLDTDRILFLREYLRSAHRAVAEGYALRGYFAWSFMDNFEWSYGYSRRFGLIYTDYKTQRRIAKASMHWYSACVAANRVM